MPTTSIGTSISSAAAPRASRSKDEGRSGDHNGRPAVIGGNSVTEPVLEIRHVSKRFGAIKALTDVDFSLRKGEVHALCGENGAGKSTLMNIIAGVLQPDEGEIVLDGKVVTVSSPSAAQRLGIGLVHQEIALCPDATVAENMFMAATGRSRSFLMSYSGLVRDAQAVMKRLAPIDVRRK